MRNEVTITRADFNAAIQKVVQKSIEDPNWEGNASSVMLYALGGSVFAKEVERVLFEEDETDE